MKAGLTRHATARRLAALALFSAFYAGGAQAATTISTCPDFPEPEIAVTNFFEAPSYDFQEDMVKLRQMSFAHASESLQQPVGLAKGELNLGLVMQSNMIVGTDGRICARPKLLRVDAGFQHNTVYVAHELPNHTCGHSEILAHEEGHVQIDRQLLDDYKPILTKFAQDSIQQLGVVTAKTPEEAEKQMQAFINEHLQDVAAEMNKERARRQALHDTPDEYTRLGKVCQGEVAVAVRKYGTSNTIATGVAADSAHAATTTPPVSAAAVQPVSRYPTRTPAVVPFSRY